MATWITHLRIAEGLLNERISRDEFLAGNIGPDSGVPNEDFSRFDPPRKTTHWKDCENKIDSEGFYNKYIKNSNRNDIKQYSFYLGYYVHLYTDKIWRDFQKEIHYKKSYDKVIKNKDFTKDKGFVKKIKMSLDKLDSAFLEKNRENIFSACFCKIDNIDDYLDYFPKNAFNISIQNIKKYYLDEKNFLSDSFVYLTEDEMDCFIDMATKYIKVIMLERNLL